MQLQVGKVRRNEELCTYCLRRDAMHGAVAVTVAASNQGRLLPLTASPSPKKVAEGASIG